jgi:hypothetical protein
MLFGEKRRERRAALLPAGFDFPTQASEFGTLELSPFYLRIRESKSTLPYWMGIFVSSPNAFVLR